MRLSPATVEGPLPLAAGVQSESGLRSSGVDPDRTVGPLVCPLRLFLIAQPRFRPTPGSASKLWISRHEKLQYRFFGSRLVNTHTNICAKTEATKGFGLDRRNSFTSKIVILVCGLRQDVYWNSFRHSLSLLKDESRLLLSASTSMTSATVPQNPF